MLDVILYRVDPVGKINLRERRFVSLRALASFFASDKGDAWDWAEVEGACRCQARRYSADELRALVA